MNKPVSIIICCMALLVLPASGQEGFLQWGKAQKKQYTAFCSRQDKNFQQFLQKEWKAFQIKAGKPVYSAPKPDKIPKAPLPDDFREKEEKVVPSPKPPTRPSPSLPPEPEPKAPVTVPELAGKRAAQVQIIGHEPTFRFDPAWTRLSLEKNSGQESIRHFWHEFARRDSQSIIDQLDHCVDELKLGDWGRLMLTSRLARALAGTAAKENTARLLTWGWLLKSGFDVRVARAEDRVLLLYAARQNIFQNPYFTLDEKRYYVFGDTEASRIETYQGSYEGAVKALDLRQTGRFAAKGPQETRHLAVDFDNKNYHITVSLQTERIRFLKHVPQIPLHFYLDATPGDSVRDSLLAQLKVATADMPEEAAANFLLRFTQKAFDYQTDSEQFGEQKYLYPEETLYYPASDCDDRVIFFSTLVRELLGLDIAILRYPGHVATALALDQPVEGSRVTVDGRTLLIADPTYINARIGMAMPLFADEKPRILPLWKPFS